MRHAPRSVLRLVLAVVTMIALGLSNVSSAGAFSQAFFPVQSTGNRGEDVRAIQYLLRQHGAAIAADGAFGPATEGAVRDFQSRNGLGADGIVGPLTWGKLAPTLREGSRGEAVKALQSQLNAKRGAGLAVDGVFGGGTKAAVVTFQNHAGIGADGVVGPTTWKNLIWHYQRPDYAPASLCAYSSSRRDWGTAATIGQLEAAAASTYAAGFGAVAVGDIGFEHGGEIGGHISHEVGLDVDIRPIRRDRGQCSAGTQWDDSTYDQAATRELVKRIRATAPGHIKYILFNDPQLIREGLTTWHRYHDNHLHIRYCEKGHPNSRYDC